MFTPIANEPIFRRLPGYTLSIGLHAAAVSSVFARAWIVAILAAFAVQQPDPPSPLTKVILLAPPPGKPAPAKPTEPKAGSQSEYLVDGAPVVDDVTDIAWDADYSRQLLPVLLTHGGLIVLVDPLDRVRPKAAFRPDGSRVQPPRNLQRYVRLRMHNPSWWPQVERLRAIADPGGALEVMAVFPPEYRDTLSEVARLRLDEMKLTGRVAWLSLALDASRPAGVVVHDIKIDSSHTRSKVGGANFPDSTNVNNSLVIGGRIGLMEPAALPG